MCVRVAVFGVQFRRKTSSVSLAAQQFYAMVVKHAIHSWRNFILTAALLLIPVLFMIPGCIKFPSTATDPPPLPLSLSHFDRPKVPYTSVGAASLASPLASSYSDVAGRYGQPVDANAANMDDYLLDIARSNVDDYNRLHVVAATANGSGSGSLVGHFNNFALHGIAISLSLVDNALLHYTVPQSQRIVTVNHPLPLPVNKRTDTAKSEGAMTSLAFYITVSFSLSFLVASFVVFVVNQRSSKAKHSQFVSGVHAVIYWMAAFVWDLLCFAVSSVLMIVVVLAFQKDAYSDWPVVG